MDERFEILKFDDINRAVRSVSYNLLQWKLFQEEYYAQRSSSYGFILDNYEYRLIQNPVLKAKFETNDHAQVFRFPNCRSAQLIMQAYANGEDERLWMGYESLYAEIDIFGWINTCFGDSGPSESSSKVVDCALINIGVIERLLGFSRDTYGNTPYGGNIEVVIKYGRNMSASARDLLFDGLKNGRDSAHRLWCSVER